jgi:L-aspartate oxidase
MPDTFTAPPLTFQPGPEPAGMLDVTDITNSLRSLMVRKMGIVRDRPRLLEAGEDVEFWCRYVLNAGSCKTC